MNERAEGLKDFYVSRLDFLKYSLATGVAVWAGTLAPRGVGIGEAEAQALFGTNRVDPALFPQSVASGDPAPNGIVLWTRVRRAATASGRVRVGYRVALDDGRSDAEAFARPVLSGVAETSAARDHTLKVQLQRAELKPYRKYRYRFYYAGRASRTGRFKTLPAPNADVGRLSFGYISCQDYTNGYYNALYHLAREQNLDFVVHLGDYMYETTAESSGQSSFQGGGPPERNFTFPDGGRECLTLQDYRFAYKKYKTDRHLQEVHEKYAMIIVWDDHEFANDAYQTYAPDEGGTDATPSNNPRRREAANRAWAEFNPVRVAYDAAKDPLSEIVIYRSFDFGNLLTLVMTDERLYRDGPPAGNETTDRYVTPGTGAEEAEGRTMLGTGTPGENNLPRPNQLSYFLNRITRSTRRWKVWGNEVTFMQNKVANTYLGGDGLFPSIDPATAPEGIYITLDQWDGYQAERRFITRRLRDDRTLPGPAGVENFVSITGDIHSYIAGYIKEDYDNPVSQGENRPVGVELICGSVTSSNLTEIATMGFGAIPYAPDAGQFTAAVTASNPHIKYFNSNDHGYNLMEVTKDALVCTMKRVRLTGPVTPENDGSAIKERDPRRTSSEVLRRFRVPARGSTFAGQPVTGPLLVDETTGVPVPIPADAPVPSPGPGGVA
ncbi:alkaline phosphatase D family protein [Rubrobacter marinus]|uniref:alkaline phosphatase D family protein n=1 Tax=Rubrobacter marinus TaxID=2653852 RepID=UPI00140A3C07|nr:alkaline phosphatase D family protein [Rubrobacter marinus]